MELKYIVTEYGDFAIFTKGTTHSDVASKLHGKPVGAGFCTIRSEKNSINVHCYGESISLNIPARLIDEDIINKALLQD